MHLLIVRKVLSFTFSGLLFAGFLYAGHKANPLVNTQELEKERAGHVVEASE